MSNQKRIDLEGRLSEVSDDLSVWRSLVENPGWMKLMKVAEGQVNARSKSVLRTPLATFDGALAQEFEKGEASGIELFQRLPDIELERLSTEHEQLVKEIEDDTATEGLTGAAGSGSTGGGNSGELGTGEPIDPGNNSFGRDS